MINKNVEVVRRLIRNLDTVSLVNPIIVADLIRAFGIVQWGPNNVFGEDEQYKNSTALMAGIYQTPDQMAEALVFLAKHKINSYCEIGVFQGGNFLFVSEYLKRFNPNIKCIAVDPTNYLNHQIGEIIEKEQYLTFLPATSKKLEGWVYDLVMIDGDHSTFWVNEDWNNLGRYAKICMIHDIAEDSCPDVRKFWDNLKEEKSNCFTIEFTKHTSNVPLQGIGIIINQKEI